MKIAWSRLALEDMRHAHDYIAKENPVAASSLLDRILNAATVLLQHPNLGRGGRVERTREMVVPNTPFIITYRADGKGIEILAVTHASRRWPGTH